MATKKAATTKKSGKKTKKPETVVVEESIVSLEEPASEGSETLATADVDDQIELGNEVLAAVNNSLTSMSARGVSPEKVEAAFYLAFQFAFCDFLRVTGFKFDQAVLDLREMYDREVVQQSEAS